LKADFRKEVGLFLWGEEFHAETQRSRDRTDSACPVCTLQRRSGAMIQSRLTLRVFASLRETFFRIRFFKS